jgi:hypothetical protein
MASDELRPVDIDRLADYIGGALDGPEEAAVAQLIADDPRWRETYELLAPGMTAVGEQLSALGTTSDPMPADLAVRLEEALSSPIARPTVIDPALTTPTEPHVQPVRGDRHLSSVPGTGASHRSRPRRRARWAVPIAAAAGLLAFAGFGLDYLAGQTGGSDNAEGTAAGSADHAAPMMGSDAAGREAAPTLREDQILRSGTNYTSASLATAPIQSFSASKHAAAPQADTASGQLMDGLARLTDRTSLQACIAAIAQVHAAGQILVETVDYARYDDRPALVVRLTSDGATWAYATGPDCGTPAREADLLQRVKVR